MFNKYTPTLLTRTTQWSRSVKQLTNNVHLATSAPSIYVFWIGGSHNQLCTFHTLINLLVANVFYIYALHQMIEAAKWVKNGVLQSVPWSVGCLLSDVTSASCGSPNQPIRRCHEIQSMFLSISSQAKKCKASECSRTVSGLILTLHWRILKLCEASWWHCEVILKTGLR